MIVNQDKKGNRGKNRMLRRQAFQRYLLRPIYYPKWVWKNNKNRIIAGIASIILVVINYLFIPFNVPCISFLPCVTLDHPTHFWEIIDANFHHLEAALLAYAILEGTIRRFLVASKVSEVPELEIENYLIYVSEARKSVKILETWTELLLRKETNIINHFKKFVSNCRRYHREAEIKILLINPKSTFAISRISELKGSLTDVLLRNKNFIEQKLQIGGIKEKDVDEIFKFQLLIQKWLHEIETMKNDLEAEGNVSLEVKIYDTDPPYSLYSADDTGYFGYYIQGIPTTKSPQLVLHSLSEKFGEYQLSRFEEIWNSETTITLKDYLTTPDTDQYISLFNNLTDINVDDIKATLKELEPIQVEDVSISNLTALVNYLQKCYKYDNKGKKLYNPHYNIFGTGGDRIDSKTINISSISSIIASHCPLPTNNASLHIGKIGTWNVSCRVGSYTFDDKLHQRLSTNENESNNDDNLYYDKGSCFISTKDLGYDYPPKIRKVRGDLFNETNGRFVDVFKIAFPFSNFTGHSGQLNGVSNGQYLFYYQKLFKYFERSGIIIHNETHGIDELFEGENHVYIYNKGKLLNEGGKSQVISIIVPEQEIEGYFEFFKESSASKHVDKFLQIMDKNFALHKSIRTTIAYNVAAILKLALLNDKLYTIQELSNYVFIKIFKDSKTC